MGADSVLHRGPVDSPRVPSADWLCRVEKPMGSGKLFFSDTPKMEWRIFLSVPSNRVESVTALSA